MQSFFRRRWLGFLSALLPCLCGKLPLTLVETPRVSWAPRGADAGALGPRLHRRAPLVKGAGRMPLESSLARVHRSGHPYLGSTCFFFYFFFFCNLLCSGWWISKRAIPTKALENLLFIILESLFPKEVHIGIRKSTDSFCAPAKCKLYTLHWKKTSLFGGSGRWKALFF